MDTNKKIASAIIATIMALCLIAAPLSALAAQSINIDSLNAGEVGIRTENVQMVKCGHEFSFDMVLDAKFNVNVLNKITKKPYDVVLVIDRTGSMAGTRMQKAIQAARDVVGVVYDYNTGTGIYANTGALTDGAGSKIGIVTYSTNVATLQASYTFGGGVGALMDPTSSKTQIQNAIGTITASGNTNISEGIKAAKDLLDSRTGADKDRPGYIILMSDGEANEPYPHPAGAPHSNVAIAGKQIGDFLISELGGTADQNCLPTSTSHTCNSSATVLRAIEAHNQGYTLYSVGFELTQGMAMAEDTLRRVASVGQGEYYNANTGNIGDKFKLIVDTQITEEVNPVANNGVLKYVAPAGFAIQSVTLSDTFKNGKPNPSIANDKSSFQINIGDVFVARHTVSVTIKAADTYMPGKAAIMGPGSEYRFENVVQNIIQVPGYYSGSDPRYSIDLATWANAEIEVLPLARNATATMAAPPSVALDAPQAGQNNVFVLSASDLGSAIFPQRPAGALVGSGNIVNASGDRIGTYENASGGILLTLDEAIESGSFVEGAIEYRYEVNGLTSCPAYANVKMAISEPSVPSEITIIKSIDGDPLEATFFFQALYEAVNGPQVTNDIMISTLDKAGSAKLPVAADFSGTVAIREVVNQDLTGLGKWAFDESIYVFAYVDGNLVSAIKDGADIPLEATAEFVNTFVIGVVSPSTGDPSSLMLMAGAMAASAIALATIHMKRARKSS
jgi:uncharacterized protein YegL